MKMKVLFCTLLSMIVVFASAQEDEIFRKQKRNSEATLIKLTKHFSGNQHDQNEMIASNTPAKSKNALKALPAETKPAESITKALPPLAITPTIVAPVTEENLPALTKANSLRTETYYVHKEKGIAVWLDNDRPENLRNNFALHKTEPIGSMIKVRNPMNNRTLYVKVVGRLQDDVNTKNVMILLSKGAAMQLNVYDDKFVAELMIPKK